jgi:Tol biopolymer transport system component
MRKVSFESRRLSLGVVSLTMAAAFALTGCGGASGGAGGGGDEGALLDTGILTSRVVGTNQPPVAAASRGATVVGVAGASFTNVTLNSTTSSGFVPPLGNRIIFRKFGQIHSMLGDGSQVQAITSTTGTKERPALSPDGTRILYWSNSSSGPITVMNSDGTNPVVVGSGSDPRWSPDGLRIVFRALGSGDYDDLFTMNRDGSNLTNITNTPNFDEEEPDWSSDGRIVCVATQVSPSTNKGLRIMTASGANQAWLLQPGVLGDFGDPRWSPNSQRIAFDGPSSTIYRVNSDGTGLVALTSGQTARNPSWSGDGARIAFEDGEDIWTMDANGGTRTNITVLSTVTEEQPDWSRQSITSGSGPLIQSRRLVGTGGFLNVSAVAGFMQAVIGNTLTSFLAFDTSVATVAGRSLSRVERVSSAETESQNLLMTIRTAEDSTLSYARFFNGNNPHVSVNFTGPFPNAALVTYDANTGHVVSILPYTATRSGDSGVKVTREGDDLLVEGSFGALYDAKGENRAPAGVSRVRLSKTGQLLSWN